MKYIKTPVDVLSYYPWPERLAHFLCEAGNAGEFFARDIPSREMALEMADAINAHDALVEACKELLDLATWASGAPVFNPGGDAREGWLKACGAIDKGHAALALVRGEGDG